MGDFTFVELHRNLRGAGPAPRVAPPFADQVKLVAPLHELVPHPCGRLGRISSAVDVGEVLNGLCGLAVDRYRVGDCVTLHVPFQVPPRLRRDGHVLPRLGMAQLFGRLDRDVEGTGLVDRVQAVLGILRGRALRDEQDPGCRILGFSKRSQMIADDLVFPGVLLDFPGRRLVVDLDRDDGAGPPVRRLPSLADQVEGSVFPGGERGDVDGRGRTRVRRRRRRNPRRRLCGRLSFSCH